MNGAKPDAILQNVSLQDVAIYAKSCSDFFNYSGSHRDATLAHFLLMGIVGMLLLFTGGKAMAI
jgi:hypothetical protein